MQLPGYGNRPGIGAGIGAGIGGGLIGAGIADRINLGDRGRFNQGQRDRLTNWQDNLGDRLHDRPGYGDWDDVRDHWQDHHQDWHDWNDHGWHDHDHWHHGYWPGYYGNWWHTTWYNYPYATNFGVTPWGVNAMSYEFGYAPYSNPYYEAPVQSTAIYDYSQPVLSMTAPPVVVESPVVDPGGANAPPPAPEANPAMDTFDEAREAFKERNYQQALTLTDRALAKTPKDNIIHEFRAITLMCLAKYRDAAAVLHSVLATSPGMDWTTLSSLFANVEEYKNKQEAIEQYARENPRASEAYFLLYYLYKTTGYTTEAAKMIKKVTELNPKDPLSRQLLSMITPIDTDAPAPPRPNVAGKEYSKDQLVGTWKAKTDRGSIQLALDKDGTFVWTYQEGGKDRNVRGVFDVDQNTLAMEPDTGGTMLAEVELTGSTLKFKMVGGPENDPGLVFNK